MTITEISGMLDVAIKDVTSSKEALEKAKKEYDETITAADKNYNQIAGKYDSALAKVQSLRNQLNTELNKFSPAENTGRVRGAA